MKRLYIFILVSLFFVFKINAQATSKDTLYFYYSEKYVFEPKYSPNSYIIEDGSDIGYGTFFFEKMGTEHQLEPKKILCLKKYVRSSKFYNKHKKVKLNDYRLSEHFENYIIYLVKKDKGKFEYIKVRANFEIE